MHHQKVWTVLNVHFDQGYSQGSVSISWVRQQFILTGFTRKSVHAICHWTDQTDVSVTLRFEAHWKFKAVTGNNLHLISLKFFLSNSLPLSSTCWQSLRSFCFYVGRSFLLLGYDTTSVLLLSQNHSSLMANQAILISSIVESGILVFFSRMDFISVLKGRFCFCTKV